MSENSPVQRGQSGDFLLPDAVVNFWLTTAADGKHHRVAHYKLSAVTATPKWAKQ